MISLKQKIQARIGIFWWYAIILFFVQRLSDVVNAFVGLWLVPRYVPPEELGAVLPLAQIGGVLGLPLSILFVPFLKFLNEYSTRGEYGKVKRLLLNVLVVSGCFFVLTLLYAQFIMPLVFERMRVGIGSLSLLIIMTGIVGATVPVFTNALQALKRFRMIAVINLLMAPLRLLTMLAFMPFRALSGYFLGQFLPALMTIPLSLYGLRRDLSRNVQSEPYWRQDWQKIVAYTIPVALVMSVGTFQSTVESFVIRHRLLDMDSAGYYVISRFAEIGSYVSLTLIFVMFPMVSELHVQGRKAVHLLWQALSGILITGFALVLTFTFAGTWLLGLLPVWAEYVAYAQYLPILTIIFVLRASMGFVANYEMACSRFFFVGYMSSIACIECLFLYAVTGYSFFEGRLPSRWVDWMASLDAARLNFLLRVMLISTLATLMAMSTHFIIRHLIACRKVESDR